MARFKALTERVKRLAYPTRRRAMARHCCRVKVPPHPESIFRAAAGRRCAPRRFQNRPTLASPRPLHNHLSRALRLSATRARSASGSSSAVTKRSARWVSERTSSTRRRKLADEKQAADARGASNTKHDLGETRYHQRIGSIRLKGRRNADDRHRVTGQLKAI